MDKFQLQNTCTMKEPPYKSLWDVLRGLDDRSKSRTTLLRVFFIYFIVILWLCIIFRYSTAIKIFVRGSGIVYQVRGQGVYDRASGHA